MTMKSLNEGVSPVRTVRVPNPLWGEFVAAAKSSESKPADVLRGLIEGYVWQHSPGARDIVGALIREAKTATLYSFPPEDEA